MKKIVLAVIVSLFAFPALAFAGDTVKVSVNGMVCDFCAQGIKKKFSSEKSVSSLEVNLSDKLVTLSLKEGQELNDEEITKILEGAGYSVVAINRE